jgi:hypothetical protein
VAFVLVPAAVSASGAAGRARAATARLDAAQRDARAVLEARAEVPAGASDGLAEAAIAALAAAGMPASALDSLTPDSGSPGSGPAVLRRATLSLRCTLPQAGKLMEVWPRFAPAWTITAADLSPVEAREAPQPGPLPLRATLTLEGLFAQEDGV